MHLQARKRHAALRKYSWRMPPSLSRYRIGFPAAGVGCGMGTRGIVVVNVFVQDVVKMSLAENDEVI